MRTDPEAKPTSWGPVTPDGKRWCRCGHAEHGGVCGATSRVKTEGVFANRVLGHEAHAPCDCYEFQPVVNVACGGCWLPGWDMRPGKHMDGSPYPEWPGRYTPTALSVPTHLVRRLDEWIRKAIGELSAAAKGETGSTQTGRHIAHELTSLMLAAKIDST